MDSIKTVRFFEGFRLLKEVDDAVIIFNGRWHTYGQFEIHLPRMAPYIKIDNRVVIDQDGRKAGVIKYLHTDDDGTVTIKGFTLLWLLSQRITVPDTGRDNLSYNAPVEDIMVDVVRRNAVDCVNSKRILPGLIVSASKGRGEKMPYQTRYDNLLDVLEELSRVSMLGVCVRMDLDAGKDVFEVLEGKDRSASQQAYPPVIFRRAYGNIETAEYTLDDSSTKNCAYTAGQGEGAERAVYIVGDGYAGAERKETFVDARDIEDASELPARGKTKLADMVRQESFEATITTDWYKKRWDMGDIVTVIDDETGITLTHYISEVQETQDANGFEVIPTFGIPESSITGGGTSGGYSSGGGGTGDATYTFTQSVPAAVWEIHHSLGKCPAVTIVDSSGSMVMGEASYIDRNTVKLSFSGAFSGIAYLN